jgi:hypothetical protein
MKRISTLLVSSAIAISAISTPSKAIDPTAAIVAGGAAIFAAGTYYGKKWEREDSGRKKFVVQAEPNYGASSDDNYMSGPVGQYYYQPMTYSYQPQRVIIKDNY